LGLGTAWLLGRLFSSRGRATVFVAFRGFAFWQNEYGGTIVSQFDVNGFALFQQNAVTDVFDNSLAYDAVVQ
ncbi:MAG: hypothetical protein WCS07_11825, partial [Sphaerochaeta sp.]